MTDIVVWQGGKGGSSSSGVYPVPEHAKEDPAGDAVREYEATEERPTKKPTEDNPEGLTGVPCRVCKKWLRSFKVGVHFNVEKDGDVAMVFEYECYRCYAKLNNSTLGEAIQKIIEQRPDTRRERKRNK